MMMMMIIIIMAEKIGEDKIDNVSKHDCNAKSIYKVVITVKHWRKCMAMRQYKDPRTPSLLSLLTSPHTVSLPYNLILSNA